MGAGLATARPTQESSRWTAAEDRGVTRTNWMHNLVGNLVLDSVTILVACNLAIFVARKIVPRAAKSGAEAAKSVRRRDELSTVEMLPEELLCSISDYLPLVDCMSFRSVCKSWRSVPFGRSEMANFSHGRPWLLFYGLDDKDDTCYLYSESHPKCCTLKLPGLRGATCVESMYGWILARRGRRFFYYNPLSMENIELAPEYPHSDAAEQVYAFNSFPPSPYCTAFVVSRREQSTVEISSCRVGDKEWVTEKINVGEWLFGTLVFADTSYADIGVYIRIYTHSSFLSYNITNKKWNCRQRPPNKGTESSSFFSDIIDVHHNDWLFKFGKRGISVSTCPLRMNIGTNSTGLVSSTRTVFASGIKEGGAGLKNVKAAWIEPPGYKSPTQPMKLSSSFFFEFFTGAALSLILWNTVTIRIVDDPIDQSFKILILLDFHRTISVLLRFE